MPIESTNEFDKDIKRISKEDSARISEAIQKLERDEQPGKPLLYVKNVFSMRIGNKRLIYKFEKEGNHVLLLFFKSREQVYDYLRKIQGKRVDVWHF